MITPTGTYRARRGPYALAQVLPLIVRACLETHGKHVAFDGVLVRFSSARLRTFVGRNGTICAECGAVGSYFTIDSHKPAPKPNSTAWHLNLWARSADGAEVLMTSDHIIPLARGGAKNHPRNRQTMCSACNHRKGSTMRPADVGRGRMRRR